MAEQPRESQSREELEFLNRWRQLIDGLGGSGGQKRVAEIMDWTTSTMSRDYQGITLPNDQRLRELSNYLRLAEPQRYELEILLRHARDARHSRRKADNAGPVAQAAGSGPAGEAAEFVAGAPAAGQARSVRHWLSRRPRVAVAVTTVVVAAVAAATIAWSAQGDGQAGPAVLGTYTGRTLQTVPVPVKSLGQLAKAFDAGRTTGAVTVTGYEFRSAQDTSLCLTAADTGPTAGQDRDPVVVAPCTLAANQVWIPEQWEINGSGYSHLVSARYPSKCLNAKKPLGAGQLVMLWKCYVANNESWDFGDWYQSVKQGHHAYPFLLHYDPHTGQFCLDADNSYGDSGAIRIRVQQATPNQFWT